MKLYGVSARAVLTLAVAIVGIPAFIIGAATEACAQSTAALTSQQLDSLTAPIALYPDALLAQVLMASTFPQEVQAAAAWSKGHPQQSGDDAVKAVASEPWDPSVQSLVAFPQVLATMASKPEWVTHIGDAFLAQPNAVMDSVQRLRKQAQQAGNLKSNEQQKVVVEQNTIQIQPANPQVVYVPTYNPTVVYGPWLYPAYPPVYIPPPPGYAFASGIAAGIGFGVGIAVTNALWGGVNWSTGSVNVNVNHFNNINVNHLSASSGTVNWNRNNTFNRNASRFNSAQLNNFRGRDESREQAMQTLERRTGENLSGSASQRLQDIHKGGGFDMGGLRNNADFANRNNALRGAGDGDAARWDTQRGESSRDAFANNDFRGDRFGERGSGGGFGGDRFRGGGFGGDRFGGGGFGGDRFGGGFGGRFRR